ncbi:Transcriptional repressor tup12-related protein [Tritrichomonas foetus]|uniref:Transcriptional repressor tup12-related protein n=1 Tax=Tritrichomonas foetus TaxID=1144522 RepID=A0A1J4K8H7_9EUKA|nr:Transcriptional repressor tup12-related protein [Tritrichomonas foetus]|eukprot:OHT06012.1 Transcriptional repressor tup12-related protein [Tritrichomonas foetus]
MSKNGLHVTLHSTLAEGCQSGESILQCIQKIRMSVAELRDTNLDLERIRDQYIIHLQQCTEDHSILRQIYKKLKMKLDFTNQQNSAQNELDENLIKNSQIPTDITSNNDVNKTAQVQSTVPMAKRMPTIENVKLMPEIVTFQPNSPKISLRYAISTSTVICTVQFSTDGSKIAFADGNFVYIVNSEDGDINNVIELPHSNDPQRAHTRSIKFSPNDEILAVSGTNNDVLLYDVKTTKLIHTLPGHKREIASIIFNGDGSWVISGGYDGIINIWNTTTFEKVSELSHPQVNSDGMIVALATTPEIPFYAIGFGNGSIGIYNEQFTPPMTNFTAHNTDLMYLTVSPFDETIATVSKDNTVKVWVMRGVASCKHTLEGHSDIVLSAAFSPSAPILFTGSKDQSIRMWNHKTGAALGTIMPKVNTIFQLDHHPTTNTIVSCSGEGVVCIWDYSL